MALQTKQLTASGSRGHHRFILNLTENSVSTDRNSSSVSFSFQIQAIQNGWNWNISTNPISYNINIEGTNYNGTINSYSGSGTITLKTGTQELWHNSEGKLNMNVSFSVTDNTGQSYTCGNASANMIMPLTAIARSTNCPNLSGDIESTYNIALNPASSSFTHSIKVSFGNISGFINANGNLQSSEYKFSNNNINFTMPSNFYQQFTGKFGTGVLTLATYNGSSKIGEKTATLTANCLESRCRPSILATVKDTNTVTIALTGDANKIVKGFSNVTITPTIKSATTNGDTSSSIKTKIVDGIAFTTNAITINKASKKDFTVTVTNSRGFSTTVIVSATGTLVNYFSPIINANFARTNQTSAQVDLVYSGTFFNASFGNVANTMILKWYYQTKTSDSWILGGTITPSINGNTINQATINCGSIYDYQTNYRFKLEAVDKISNGNQEMDVTAGIPNFAHGKGWFRHNTIVDFRNGLNLYHNTPYIDFHFNNASNYTCRLMEKSQGVLNCTGKFSIQDQEVLMPQILYNNISGTNGNVPLSKSSKKISCLEIFYGKKYLDNFVNHSYIKVAEPFGKKVLLISGEVMNGDGRFQIQFKEVVINETSITNDEYRGLNITGSINHFTENEIYIYKVIGY